MSGSKTNKALKGRTDWEALRSMSDNDVERVATADDINPGSDEHHWARATRNLPSAKTAVYASFDRDVVDFFKRGGRDYKERMNAVLRRYMEAEQGRKA